MSKIDLAKLVTPTTKKAFVYISSVVGTTVLVVGLSRLIKRPLKVEELSEIEIQEI